MGGRSIGEGPGDALARRNVLECLAEADGPLGALDVSRRTHLSTLVVIPVLTRLTEEALVSRGRVSTGSGRQDVTWAYELTGRGARAVATGTARRTG
jgi:predicted ArsR family transcriptional regulator